MDSDEIVAVSYSYDNEKYKEKVIRFVSRLREKCGYYVIMDELLKQKETSIDFNEMMSKMITNADKVIVLLTPKYKEKADQFLGGVGAEYRIILDEINKYHNKYIFAVFDPFSDDDIDKIKPSALGNREIIHIPDSEDQWDTLLSKLSDEPIYDFPNVAVKKAKPRKKAVNFKTNIKKSDLFNHARILLSENKQILEQFGPDSRVAIIDPMSSAVDTWNKAKLNTIIPNNRKIVEEFESNISVLSMEEVEIFKKFKIHADAFESCSKGKIGREGIPEFPLEFERMIKGGAK